MNSIRIIPICIFIGSLCSGISSLVDESGIDMEMVGKFIKEVIDLTTSSSSSSSSSPSVIIISTPEEVEDLTLHHHPPPPPPLIYYNINNLNQTQIKRLKNNIVKDNIQPIYFVISSSDYIALSAATVIRYFDAYGSIIMFDHNTIKRQSFYIYNAYLLRQQKKKGFNLFEICMFCNKGEDQIKNVNSWNFKRGFSSVFQLPQSFKNNFYGKSLEFDCGVKKWFDDEIFPTMNAIAKYMNFEIKLVQNPVRELQKTLYSDKADFGGCFHSVTHVRHKWADFSHPYSFSGLKMYSIKPRKGLLWYSFIKPFEPITWSFIIFSIILAGFILYLLYYFENDKTTSLYDCIWDAVRIFCWDNFIISEPTLSVCLHLGAYMLCALALISAYMGLVTSFLISPPYLWTPIDSLEQVRYGDIDWIVRKGLYEDNFFQDDEMMQDKKQYIPYNDSLSTNDNNNKMPFITLLNYPRSTVFIGSGWENYLIELYTDTDGSHPFHTSRDSLSLGYTSFFFKKNTLYQHFFTVYTMRLWDFGISFYEQEMFNNLAKLRGLSNAINENRIAPVTKSDQLQLSHLTGPFIIFFIGSALAVVSLFGENLICFLKNGY